MGVKRVKFARLLTQVAALSHVMKSIEVYSMSPVEAVMEAANTSDLPWFRVLLSEYGSKVCGRAMITAARNGYVEAVRILSLEIIGAETWELIPSNWRVLRAKLKQPVLMIIWRP